MSALELEYPLEYNHDALQLCKTDHDDVSRTRMTTLAFILYAISCPLHNLNTLWYIIMILNSYVEQVLMISRVQE